MLQPRTSIIGFDKYADLGEVKKSTIYQYVNEIWQNYYYILAFPKGFAQFYSRITSKRFHNDQNGEEFMEPFNLNDISQSCNWRFWAGIRFHDIFLSMLLQAMSIFFACKNIQISLSIPLLGDHHMGEMKNFYENHFYVALELPFAVK